MGYRNLNGLSDSPQRKSVAEYSYFGQTTLGGQYGLTSAAAGDVLSDKATRAAASSSKVFFTVNSFLMWDLHRDNVAADGPLHGLAALFKFPRNVTK